MGIHLYFIQFGVVFLSPFKIHITGGFIYQTIAQKLD